jgi:tetratricopeptide (TPR) repeat protein
MALRNDLAGALEHYRTAVAICERLAISQPQDLPRRQVLWDTLTRIADVLLLEGNVAGAIETNGKAAALGETLLAENPLNAGIRRALTQIYMDGGRYRRQIDRPGALEFYRKAVLLHEESLAADPANAATRHDLGFTHKLIGDQLANLNENSQALVHLSKAREIFEKVTADAPGDVSARFRVVTCGAGLASMQASLGQIDLALEECRKSAGLLREISEDPTNAQHRSLRAEAYEYLGHAYVTLAELPQTSATEKRRHWSAARDLFQESLNVLDDLRSRGALDPAAEPWAKGIAGQIAKCDTALGK